MSIDIRSYIPLGQTPDVQNMDPSDDAFKSPLQQIPEGYQQTIQPLIHQGLGLARDAWQAIGRGAEALTPSRETLGKVFAALEAGSAHQQGQTPLYLQMQDRAAQAQQRLDLIAQQARQADEAKRQHDMQMLEKIMTSSNAPGVKQKMLEGIQGPLAPQARELSKAMKDSDYESFNVYKDLIPNEVQQSFAKGTLKPGEIGAWVESAREQHKVNMKEQVKQKVFQDAMNKPEDQRSPYEQQIVEEHTAASELKRTKSELQSAQAANAWLNPNGNQRPDRSTLNRIHESQNNGQPFEAGTPASQQSAIGTYAKLPSQGRMQVNAETPVGQTGRSQEFRDPVTMQAAPSWATPSDLQRMGFVNIEPSQANTIAQAQTVDQMLKEILTAGSALTRHATGASLSDVPVGFMQTPLVKLITGYAGDPNAAVLQSALTRIGPVLGRMAGDTHISNIDSASYKEALFSPSDTVESLLAKIKSVQTAQAHVRKSMGFVPDQAAYLRQLVIRGLPDEQIKAIMEERKRMQ